MQVRFFSCRLWAILLLLAGTGFLSSCQSGMVPADSHLHQKSISLEDLRQRLLDRQKGLSDLKSFVHTTVETKGRKRSLRQALLVRGAETLRIDTLSLLGQPLGVYIFNGQNMKGQRSVLYDTRRNRVFQGIEVREMLVRILGIELNLEEYISVFAGNIPRLEALKMIGGALDQERTVYQLTGVDPADKSRMEIEVDAYTLLPGKVSRTLLSGEVIRIQWQDYRIAGDRNFPHRIIIEFPAKDARLTLIYTDPVVNAGIPDESFELSIGGKKFSLSGH
ncbi:MAG: DUF4292 domain-containing protein [Nitrospinae bacterium]|nr:DUF4292 domain-containing protein [Nitrospinota bacterium]